jgi:hypothetical protein
MSTQALTRPGQNDIVRDGAFDLTPRSLSEAMQLAELMCKSALVPQGFKDRPADVLVAVQYGAEVGLKPLQALQSIAVINGRPCIWGDGLLGIVLNSGMMENYKEMTLDEIEASGKAVFWAKRKGQAEPIQREFSIENAKKAGLWDKAIWKQYPYRMLQMRARSWALRDGFADVIKGLAMREEVEDYTDIKAEAPKVLAMPRRMSERQLTNGTSATDNQGPTDATTEQAQQSVQSPLCPKCEMPMNYNPEGITKSGKNAGKPHKAYWKCAAQGCDGFKWAEEN